MMKCLSLIALALLVLRVAASEPNLKINRVCTTTTCASDSCASTETFELGCVQLPDRGANYYRSVKCSSSGWHVGFYSDEKCTAKTNRKLVKWEDMTSDSLGCATLNRGVWVYKGFSGLLIHLCPLTSEQYVCEGKGDDDRTACHSFKIKDTAEHCIKSSRGDLYYTSTFNTDDNTMTLSVYLTETECNSNGRKMLFLENQPLTEQSTCLVKTETINAVCSEVEVAPNPKTKTRTIATETTSSSTTTETTNNTTTATETTNNTTAETTITDLTSNNTSDDNDTLSGYVGFIPVGGAACLISLFILFGLMN